MRLFSVQTWQADEKRAHSVFLSKKQLSFKITLLTWECSLQECCYMVHTSEKWNGTCNKIK